MADILRRPFISHLRSTPTMWVRHLNRGQTAHEGAGIAFWFRPLSAALSEVPLEDRELTILFRLRTRDFQDATVQGTLTYRITDPALAASRLDFGVDPHSGAWRGAPLDQIAALLNESALQHAVDVVAGLDLTEALTGGLTAMRDRITEGLRTEERLAETGVAVVGVRVVSIRPEAELERALQAPAREQAQQAADAATYQRRALAVERERAIAENELQNQIELAGREEKLVERKGRNERRRAEEAAAAARIESESRAARERLLAEAQADARRALGAADADAQAASVAAYRDADPAILLALAARAVADHLPDIGSLHVTPDLVTGALARLTAPSAPGPASQRAN